MLNLDDKFEVLQRMREHLGRVTDLYRKMNYWMDEEEKQLANKTMIELKKDIEQLEQECIEDNICPECGGHLESKSWEDDCGKVGVIYCESCGKKWEE